MLAKPLVYRILRITLGIIFLLLSIIGGLLPVVQGWMFLFVALYLFSYDIPIVRRTFRRLEERFPRHADGLHAFEARMKQRLAKWKHRFARKPAVDPAAPNDPAAKSAIKHAAK